MWVLLTKARRAEPRVSAEEREVGTMCRGRVTDMRAQKDRRMSSERRGIKGGVGGRRDVVALLQKNKPVIWDQPGNNEKCHCSPDSNTVTV